MTFTTDVLLEKLDFATRKNDGMERVLYLLLKANEKHIDGLIEQDLTGRWFHKAFRTCDVCGDGYTDAAIHILLGESELFWLTLRDLNKKLGNTHLYE